LQLHKAPLDVLIAEFGHVEGHFLKAVGMGEDTKPVVAYTRAPEVKSVGRQYCLANNEHDQRIILQNIYELYEEVALKLRRLHKKTRSVGIYLSGAYTVTGHLTTQTFVDRGDQLFGMAMQVLVREAGGLPVGYIRRMGVWAGYLEDARSLTLPLFQEDRKKEKIVQLTDTLNDRFGTHTIRNGFLLKAKKLTTVPNGFMSDKYERAKLANADN
jgi:DNA polymerase V